VCGCSEVGVGLVEIGYKKPEVKHQMFLPLYLGTRLKFIKVLFLMFVWHVERKNALLIH
jgi:hypothetical protein